MAKVELKGIIKSVSPVEYVGENKTAKQNFVLLVAGYVDDFGDKKGIDEEWQIAIMGDRVAKIGLAPAALEKRAKCSIFVNGKKVQSKDNPLIDIYIINAVLSAIEIL